MPPSYLVLDIETIIDPELPQGEGKSNSGLPPAPFHRIIVLGVLWLDAAYRVRRLGIIGDDQHEHQLLTDFSSFVSERKPDLVTYNGRGFDLPVIAARCLRHGVPLPHYYGERDVRYRFSPSGHLDLMDFLTDFGATRASRLDVIAKVVGMPGKVGVAGKDVGPLYHAGRLSEVQDYCLCDVVQTAGVFLRVQLVRGVLSRDGYLAAMHDLLEHVDADTRLAPVATAMNRKRLLLENEDAASVSVPAPATTSHSAVTDRLRADTKPEEAETEQAETEQAETEQAETEQAETEQAKPEQAEPEQAETEQAETEQAKPEQGGTSID